MCRFLTPPRKGVYYFRRPIPEPLRPIIGQREWIFSLGVKDRDEAKQLVAIETVRTDGLLTAAKKALAEAQPKNPAQLAQQRRLDEQRRRLEEQQQAQLEEDGDAGSRAEEYEREDRIAAQTAEAEHLAYVVRTGKTARMEPSEAVRVRAVREAEQRAEVSEESLRFVQAELAALRQQGNAMPPPPMTLPKSSPASQRTPQGTSGGATVTGLFKLYGTTGKLTPAIVSEWTTKVDRFVEFIGHDDAGRVTTEDIRLWRNHVRDEVLPSGKRRSAQTINSGYVAPLRSAFKHGVEEGLIPTNPARDVSRVSPPKVAKIREKDFTKAEQATILTAASEVDVSGKPTQQALVRRWVPWICAYTGARVNEITQLRAEDIQQIDGHWIIKITPEAGTVKTGDFRYVPVHEHLLAQGFLAMVQAQAAGPIFYDPEKGDPESERGQYKKAGERLAAWVRGLGITDPSIKPNHAWRHTFKTIADEAGVAERAADYMQGHASKGVGRTYGHSTITALADQIKKFPRFDPCPAK